MVNLVVLLVLAWYFQYYPKIAPCQEKLEKKWDWGDIIPHMHPVVKNLLARQDRKVPFKDNRKIVLVLFGGLMTGIRGCAATIALEELGLRFAFDEIYVISAGFINASYFLSGQPRLAASIYLEANSVKKFINFWRFWKIVDIDYMISVMKTVKKLNIKNILTHPTKLHVRLMNTSSKEIDYLEAQQMSKRNYMHLMEAATSLTLFHPGSTKIGKNNYTDPDFRKHQLADHMKKVLSCGATDILVVHNNLGQYHSLKKSFNLPKNMVYQIYPESGWPLNRFETKTEKLRQAAEQMGQLVKHVFGKNNGINLDIDYDGRH